jgi:DNA-binding LacI/PurR family transcriptional regulator
MAEKITISTVAEHAGVSRQTVSNVLNSPHLVREETRERVLASVHALGYRVSQAARQMRTGRSRLLAVRIDAVRDGINGSVLDRFLHGLTESADVAGYRLMLYTAPDATREITTFDDLLGAYDLDGFVLDSTHHGDPRTAWLAERGVPFVTFGRPWGGPDPHPWVDVDGAAGTEEATRHLLAAGHRRIGYIGWPEGDDEVADDRRAGWERALRAAGLDPAGLHVGLPDGIAEGGHAARGMLALADPPTALVCASDSLALGALGTGDRSRPGAPAVIGFDDTPVAQAIGMSSVSQPLAEVAGRCIDLLIHRLDRTPDGTVAEAEHILLAPRLVVRSSG